MKSKLDILWEAWSPVLTKMRPGYNFEKFQEEIEKDPQVKLFMDVTLKAMELYGVQVMETHAKL